VTIRWHAGWIALQLTWSPTNEKIWLSLRPLCTNLLGLKNVTMIPFLTAYVCNLNLIHTSEYSLVRSAEISINAALLYFSFAFIAHGFMSNWFCSDARLIYMIFIYTGIMRIQRLEDNRKFLWLVLKPTLQFTFWSYSFHHTIYRIFK
jgi:hypothetical protein